MRETVMQEVRQVRARDERVDESYEANARLTRLFYGGKLLPTEQLPLMRNQGWLFAQRKVPRGDKVSPLPYAASQLEDIVIEGAGGPYDLADYVHRNRVGGLLIMKNGKVLLEHYDLGNDDRTPWVSMSVAKSIGTTLIGCAIHDGLIRSVDELLTRYLPRLKNTNYEGVTIRHLMTMSTGLCWDETHTVAGSERRQMLELQIEQKPGLVIDYLANRARIAPPGELWEYATGDAHLIGALLHAATSGWASDYLSAKIWSTIGMEHPTQWWLEAPDGFEATGSGINATLRDYARFGQFFLNGGVVNGRSILPEGWTTEAGASRTIGGKRVDYGYMWWGVPGRDGLFTDRAYSARGIFGQYIYINPALQLVIVTLSARAKPRFSEVILDNDFFNAAANAVR